MPRAFFGLAILCMAGAALYLEDQPDLSALWLMLAGVWLALALN